MDKAKGADLAVKLFPLSLHVHVDVLTEEKLRMQMAAFERFRNATGRKFHYEP
jgi:hypothetical protein